MKQNEIRFSVLIAVYYKDKPDAFHQCLESVVKQTVQPDEIVIVEDGPLPSDLKDILVGYTLAYKNLFHIISLESNMGLGYALNIGVQNSKFDYIARMDADDIAVPNRFELQTNAFKQNNNLSIVGGQIDEFFEDESNSFGFRNVPLTNEEIFIYAKRRNPFNHMTVMFKKSDVLNSGNYQTMPFFEDYYLWMRMLNNGAIALNLSECLVFVRVGRDMITRRGGLAYAKKIVGFQKKLLDLKFVSITDFAFNCLIRVAVSITPCTIRRQIYKRALRKGASYGNAK